MRPRHLTFNEPEPTVTPDPVVKEIIEQVFPPKRKLPRHLDFAKKYQKQKKQSETVEEPEEQPEESEEPEKPDKPSFKGRPRHLDFARKYKKKVEENKVEEERITYPVSLPIYRMLMPQSSKKGVEVEITEETTMPRLRRLFREYHEEIGNLVYTVQGGFRSLKGLKSHKDLLSKRQDTHKDLHQRFRDLEKIISNKADNLKNYETISESLTKFRKEYGDLFPVADSKTVYGDIPQDKLEKLSGIIDAEEEAIRMRRMPQEETQRDIEPEPESEEFIRKRWSPEDEDFEPEQRAVSIFIPADDPRITEI